MAILAGRAFRTPVPDRFSPPIESLEELDLPTLLVAGKLDMPGIHEIANRIVDANRSAELVVVPEVAHMVNMEKPKEFNRLLLDNLYRF